MKKFISLFILLSAMLQSCTQTSSTIEAESEETRIRWTPEQANEWQAETGWLVGCNFVPSTAINELEMWQKETFDEETIDRELGLAASIGFNSVRVYLHDLLWVQDSAGFIKRMDRFLDIAGSHEIGVLFVLLDGVWNPFPKIGVQPEPKPFTHNSGWVQSPGKEILGDTTRWKPVEAYVKGVIHHFADDPRIHGWDVFNEPDNKFGEIDLPNKHEMAFKMLKKVFGWAREANPSQPLTAGIWYGSWHPDSLNSINRYMLSESDIISFHAYGQPEPSQENILFLKAYNRPLLCTEYVARGNNNNFHTMLPFFKENQIAGYNWGLVDGKTQTIYPWDSWSKEYTSEPDPWHHDIFRKDGSPYKEEEVELIRGLIQE
jgi:hypothetical protein